MARINFSAAVAAERESIAETRRLYYEALATGMSVADAVAYSSGKDELATPKQPDQQEPKEPLRNAGETRETRRAVEIPEDWASLPYVPRAAGAANLKSLAAHFSDTPIRNKAEAEKAIRAELDLRAKEEGEARSAIEIPESWQSLPLADQIVLAAQFTSDELKTEGDVERVLQTEIARRAG